MLSSIFFAAVLLVGGCSHAGQVAPTPVADVRPSQVAPTSAEAVLAPAADHHLHLASPFTVEVLTPTPAPPVSAELPAALRDLLSRRELQAPPTLELVSSLYTRDAVARARRGGGWVSGTIAIARLLTDYGPGYRLLPVTHEMRGDTGYVAGYFVRGRGYNATFQFSLRREAGVWKIAVDNIIPIPPVMVPQPSTAQALIAELDAAGIRYGLVHSAGYFFAAPGFFGSGDEEASVRAENDWTSQQIAQYPDRLMGFCGVSPLREYAVREIERCSRLPGMVGVKLHFGASAVSLRDPDHVEKVRRIFSEANRLRLPIAAHVQEVPVQEYGRAQAEILLNQIIPAAPDVAIQIMHMAANGPGYGSDSAFEVLAAAREAGDPRMRNVYVDVALSVVAATPPETLELVARRLRQFGLDHVLFGSDRAPGVNGDEPRTAWQAFLRLPLTAEEFRTVAGNVAPYLRQSIGRAPAAARR